MSETNHFEFKAEVKELLNILVHSLYTNREIFVRELISNSSDALDKLRFESNKGTEIIDNDLPLEISVSIDKDNSLIIIKDTGIGMNKEDLINNIGTIAKSGTAQFLKELGDNKQDANNIIGKFGVGFYSVFMIADKVELTTKSFKADEDAVKWTSDGLGAYDIDILEGDVKRGTEIKVFVKEEAKEFLEDYKVEQAIKQHSNFISFPIKFKDEQLNNISAIWREPKSSVKKEDYNEFYKFLTYDNEDPFEVIHSNVDVPIQFSCLLFVPKKNADMMGGYNREDFGLDLYVRRVLIQKKNQELIPEYFGFVKGVVDSEDIPLNISRETLQENVVFSKISNSVVSQIYSALNKMAENDPDRYNEFWNEHGKLFKLGYSDYSNREKYSNLLRFNSSLHETEKELSSLEAYVKRVKEDQKEIYFVSGSSRNSILLDPHLEIFKSKGIEVIFLYDAVDEFIMTSIMKYEEFELKSIDQADLSKIEKYDSIEDKKETPDELNKEEEVDLTSLLEKIKSILGDKVTEVKISQRLSDSPACLVNPDGSMSATMQKIMSMANQDLSVPKKLMEINKDHKLVRNLLKVYKSNNDDDYINSASELLYESALLLEGVLHDPHNLVSRINNLLSNSSDWYTSVKDLK